MTLTVLFADDEQPARSKLYRLLSKRSDVGRVLEACNGLQVLEQLQCQPSVDLLLLDINMPKLGGLDVARELVGRQGIPYIIFITAYDEHAVEAFELNAVDYLLKPYTEARLASAIERAKNRSAQNDNLNRVLAQLAERRSRHLLIKTGEKFEFVELAKIDWVESNGNYVSYHCGKQCFTQRNTMERCSRQLGDGFIRIHLY